MFSAPEQFRREISESNSIQKLCDSTFAKLLNQLNYFASGFLNSKYI